MSKKVLNSKTIINELRGQSAYFRKEPQEDYSSSKQPKPGIPKPEINDSRTLPREPEPEKETRESPLKTEAPAKDLQVAEKDDNLSEHASKHASMQANHQDDIVETIRKTVKQVGAKTLFIRLTPEEKHELASVVFTFNEMYRGEGRKTSENEIGRIALNFLIEDYRAKGKESVLARVLAALVA
jgi:hypothetical protein